jgi:hypothetical protein
LLPQNPAAIAGVMAGVTVAQTWALVRLDDDHPRLARFLVREVDRHLRIGAA